MSMLTRYKRSGGFVQLLQLIETCDNKKQEKLLENIKNEDPKWEEAIREKCLSIKKIFSWDADTLSDILMSTQELTVAITFYGLSEEERNKATKKAWPHSKKENRKFNGRKTTLKGRNNNSFYETYRRSSKDDHRGRVSYSEN